MMFKVLSCWCLNGVLPNVLLLSTSHGFTFHKTAFQMSLFFCVVGVLLDCQLAAFCGVKMFLLNILFLSKGGSPLLGTINA